MQQSTQQSSYYNSYLKSNESQVFDSMQLARRASNEQHLMAMLEEYRGNPPPPVSSANNGQFVPVNDIYNDESMNIYTEPTIIDNLASEDGMGNVLLSVPPLPPPPPPPIFTAPVMLSHTTTSSVLKEPKHSAEANSEIQTNSSDLVTLHQSAIAPDQRTESQLTIIGQDLEITVSNGEITQTVLNSEPNPPLPPPTHFNPQFLYYYSAQRVEFLPLCDLLFNIISLAAYFCDVVFDSVTAYTLFLNGQTMWFVIALALIITSATISQILSYRWYARDRKLQQKCLQTQLEQTAGTGAEQRATQMMLNSINADWTPTLAIIHLFFGGVLWRYFKLFAPVNITTVKQEVRDLCVLRMIHAFSEAAPMLLLQMYLVWKKSTLASITDLNIISIFLSLFSLCWALSSFSKNIRQNKIHKLILTWLGVIIQFFWRLGTITSRIVALTIYASLYAQWMFAVLFLHWFSMFLWLLSPAINVETSTLESPEPGRKQSKRKQIFHHALLAWVYIFCFINMEDSNPRLRMTVFYSIMFLENVLLLSISIFFDSRSILPAYRNVSLVLVLGSFLLGMLFMWLYYRYFHIRHLKHSFENENFDNTYNSHRSNYQFCQKSQPNAGDVEISVGKPTSGMLNCKLSPVSKFVTALSNQCFASGNILSGQPNPEPVERHRHQYGHESIPGVFNCRLNPALKRKKKKPSTVPPPPQAPKSIVDQGDRLMAIQKIPLETINESTVNEHFAAIDLAKTQFHNQQRRTLLNQAPRPMTNTSLLTRPFKHPSADTFWRKSNLSARSISISPSALLKTENTFRLPAKHPFSSTITTPTSPTLLPTENFTDRLELISDDRDKLQTKPTIIRPKPIVQHSVESQLNELDKKFTSIAKSGKELKNGSLYHYYYHPYNRKIKLRTQTPEILFTSNQNNSRIFYDYPSSVISVQPEVHNTQPQVYFNTGQEELTIGGDGGGGQFSNDYSNFESFANQDDLMFMQQCQRPPVPGREDKSEENDDNCSYVEGKRSLLNYGIDRSKLEKILEKRKVEQTEPDFTRTLPSELIKARTNSKPNPKKKANPVKKSRLKKRVKKLRSSSLQSVGSLDSSSASKSTSASACSSGDDGDIESDINDRKLNTVGGSYRKIDGKTMVANLSRPDEYDEAFGSGDGIEESPGSSPNNQSDCRAMAMPKIIRGPINASNTNTTTTGVGSRPRRPSVQPPGRQRPLYHSAKYKRHNTPL